MASRRIAQSSINWVALSERVPATQRPNFISFKTKSDKYLRSVLSNPEQPPALNWNQYKNAIPVAGLVDTFQKRYEALKVPYPADNYSAAVDSQEKNVKQEIQEFIKASEARISDYNKEIAHLKSLLPYEQMTMEDYRDAFPEDALDPINKPTYWPHLPEDQLGYKPKDIGAVDH